MTQSIETGLEVMIKQGFKAQQVVLGLPAYAKRLELVSPELKPMTVNGHETLIYQKHTEVTPVSHSFTNPFQPTCLWYHSVSLQPGGIADDKPGVDVCGKEQKWGGSFLTTELISNGWLSKDQKTGLNGYKRYFDECSGTVCSYPLTHDCPLSPDQRLMPLSFHRPQQPFLTNGKYFITYEDQVTSVTKAKWADKQQLAGIFL
jgi:chitinase